MPSNNALDWYTGVKKRMIQVEEENKALKAEIERLKDEGPGTPIWRLSRLAEWVEAELPHAKYTTKPFEEVLKAEIERLRIKCGEVADPSLSETATYAETPPLREMQHGSLHSRGLTPENVDRETGGAGRVKGGRAERTEG